MRLEHKPSAVVLHTPGAVLYLGDDVTDERAFAALDPASDDLTVKVGDGETVAAQRVPGPEAVVELLELFVDQARVRG